MCSFKNKLKYIRDCALFNNIVKIPSHLTLDEKYKLTELAICVHGTTYIEIGSYLGSSSSFIAKGIVNDSAKLFCIDTWQNDAMTEGKRNTYSDFIKNTSKYSSCIVPIVGKSDVAYYSIKNSIKRIDFLFIDGDHSYEACKIDWDLYSKHLYTDSLVIFHDSGWAEGVQKVINENVRPFARQEGSLPNMYWAWIK